MLRSLSKTFTSSLTLKSSSGFRTTQVMNTEINKFNDSFLAGCNAEFVENLFNKWAENPSSVGASWDYYFKNLVRGVDAEYAFSLPPNDLTKAIHMAPDHTMKFVVSDNMKARLLVDAYRIRGHEIADLDPLRNIIFGILQGIVEQEG